MHTPLIGPQLRVAPPGPQSQALAARLAQAECPTITCIEPDFPIFWERGEGALIEDVDGNTYLDLTAAFAVSSLGHGNPEIADALATQARTLLHGMGDVHPTRVKVALAEALSALTDGALGLPIFGLSGSDAIEAARKTVTLATGTPRLLAFTGAYHGLTAGALDATHRSDFRQPFLQQLSQSVTHLPYPGCFRCPYGKTPSTCGQPCLQAVEDAVLEAQAEGQPFGGILVEPIQGRGGTVVPPPGFLQGLRQLCDRTGVLLIFDEIFTGFGRTGTLFAYQHEQVLPDILCVGKALGGGMPISACLGRPEVMRAWPKSSGEALHTQTFLGHPGACAAALKTLEILARDRLVDRSRALGEHLRARLSALMARQPAIGDIRGRGLMVGIELVEETPPRTPATSLGLGLMKFALQQGLLLLPEGPHANVIGLFPPLVIREDQLDWACERIEEGLQVLRAKKS